MLSVALRMFRDGGENPACSVVSPEPDVCDVPAVSGQGADADVFFLSAMTNVPEDSDWCDIRDYIVATAGIFGPTLQTAARRAFGQIGYPKGIDGIQDYTCP